jgi:hypothetical protein
VVFYKKRRGEGARAAHLALLAIGLFLEAAFQAMRESSPAPLQGYFKGLWRGARWKVVHA